MRVNDLAMAYEWLYTALFCIFVCYNKITVLLQVYHFIICIRCI
jgi:hypothetical protein